MPYGLLGIIVVLALAGLILWAIGQFPLDPTIYKLIKVVIIVVVCIYLIMWLAAIIPSGFFLPPPRR